MMLFNVTLGYMMLETMLDLDTQGSQPEPHIKFHDFSRSLLVNSSCYFWHQVFSFNI